MNKRTSLALLISAAFLGGCGSSSDDSTPIVSNPETPTTPATPPVTETTLKCDRGILLNSTLSASSIYDEPLYALEANYTGSKLGNTISGIEMSREGQMIYSKNLEILNESVAEMDDFETNKVIFYTLNRHGLFTDQYYQKQNQGWPAGYLVASDGYKVSTAGFNDSCSFKAATINIDFEKVDLSGKTIAAIFPQKILTSYPEIKEYLYVDTNLAYLLKEDKNAFAKLLADKEVFPQGAYVYIPKSAVYPDTHIFFEQGYYATVDSFDQWIAIYKNRYTFKKDVISGLNVLYTVDADGNPQYNGGGDPLIEMNGKLHDGEWVVKGDVISTSYGASADEYSVNYTEKGEFAHYNALGYEFIKQKFQTYSAK